MRLAPDFSAAGIGGAGCGGAAAPARARMRLARDFPAAVIGVAGCGGAAQPDSAVSSPASAAWSRASRSSRTAAQVSANEARPWRLGGEHVLGRLVPRGSQWLE